ncbi:MAG: Na/Pi cotransporter family protein, partial [Bacilli bacterium]|nr:Na/Pi cotransporter family protein [Bacilli bacterium]
MGLVEAIITLIAGIGIFMIGMKMMSDGLENSAGRGLRKLFNKITNNRFVGVGIGAVVTGVIQSSSATTVMVIGFVNAGVMTLMQATAIIMGANIGTTITGILVAFSSFNVGLYATALAFIGVFISMFAKKNLTKTIGDVLASLGLIFVGLSMMSGSLKKCAEIKDAFTTLFTTVSFPLLLILLGVVFTALIQSSSATTGIVITLASQGVLPLTSALFIVIGSNIGTCVTALLASIGANSNAKRAAIIHLMFNLFGSVIFTAIVWIFSSQISQLLELMAPGSLTMQVALFHIIFNVLTTLMLIPFVKHLTIIATKLIKDKDVNKGLKLRYVDAMLMQNVPVALDQIVKEITYMGEMAKLNLEQSFISLVKNEKINTSNLYKNEEIINFTNLELAEFLIKLSSKCNNENDEKFIGSIHHVITDIERIADYAKNFVERSDEMDKLNLSFSNEAKEELDLMYRKVELMFESAIEIFISRDENQLN